MTSRSLTPFVAGIVCLIIGVFEILHGFFKESIMTIATGIAFLVAGVLFLNNDNDHGKKQLIPARVRARN
ncbi:hypothetical protein [Mucilaginibacter myungsuensis]|uniref:Uncharacterized protein n=1 Tax=Mucilaginibacter myungsuensis TaxID=649104 RepID=A0A929KYH1_9SPHI|nr:hypothetical protein [Mucilaginibacter myungsuensis]MBE9661214.1 hypothetical protein [Mucilaginibacter myungsuensis]MDN3597358.1 hypothetical protein [Mucilaginibacter myungsuensis]